MNKPTHTRLDMQLLSAPIVLKIGTGRTAYYREPITGDRTAWHMKLAMAVRRLALPYLTCTGQDGCEYLLNRGYKPLWVRGAGAAPRRVRPGELRTWTADQCAWLYHDGTPEPARVAAGRAVCDAWGISIPENLAELVR